MIPNLCEMGNFLFSNIFCRVPKTIYLNHFQNTLYKEPEKPETPGLTLFLVLSNASFNLHLITLPVYHLTNQCSELCGFPSFLIHGAEEPCWSFAFQVVLSQHLSSGFELIVVF